MICIGKVPVTLFILFITGNFQYFYTFQEYLFQVEYFFLGHTVPFPQLQTLNCSVKLQTAQTNPFGLYIDFYISFIVLDN